MEGGQKVNRSITPRLLESQLAIASRNRPLKFDSGNRSTKSIVKIEFPEAISRNDFLPRSPEAIIYGDIYFNKNIANF